MAYSLEEKNPLELTYIYLMHRDTKGKRKAINTKTFWNAT